MNILHASWMDLYRLLYESGAFFPFKRGGCTRFTRNAGGPMPVERGVIFRPFFVLRIDDGENFS